MEEDTKVRALQRWGIALVAILVFVLFAVSVVWFHGVVRVDSPDLGVSVWAERTATRERLIPVVDDMLNAKALAAWMLKSAVGVKVESSATPPANPPKLWEALNDMAKLLSEEDARKSLATIWVAQLEAGDRQRAIRAAIRESRQPLPEATPITPELLSVYTVALAAATPRWLSRTLPAPAIEGYLRDHDLVIAKTARARAGSPLAKTNPGQPTEQFVGRIHQSIADFLSGDHVKTEIQDALRLDLRFSSAQKSLVESVEKDFAGRWMWAIAAAIFLTAAVSAVLGAGWRTWPLGEGRERAMLVGAFVAITVPAACFGFHVHGPAPAFLSRPLEEFSALYEIRFGVPTSLLNAAAAAAIAALLVTSWGSFLVRTKSDAHLEHQLSALRWSFHTATFVLVAGVLHMYAFFQWPSSFLGESAAALIQDSARASALALGAVFSTLLLLIYVPGAKVLVEEARARQASASETTRKNDIEASLTRHGFDSSATQQIVRFAQLFAPLLVAPLGAEVIGLLA